MGHQSDKIIFRGMSMTADWPDKIRQAQDVQTCVVTGQEVARIRYGDESDDWGADRAPCHDCGAIRGELHVEGCDVEQCPGCGGQRFNCDCEPDGDEDEARMELPVDVRMFVEQHFPAGQWEEALSILGQARIEDGTAPDPRLLRCAAFASRGNLVQLRRLASLLAVDWRDVIVAGEYELRDKIPVQVRDLSQPLQV